MRSVTRLYSRYGLGRTNLLRVLLLATLVTMTTGGEAFGDKHHPGMIALGRAGCSRQPAVPTASRVVADPEQVSPTATDNPKPSTQTRERSKDLQPNRRKRGAGGSKPLPGRILGSPKTDGASSPLRAWDDIIVAPVFADIADFAREVKMRAGERVYTFVAVDSAGKLTMSIAVAIAPAGRRLPKADWQKAGAAAKVATRARDFPDLGARARANPPSFSPLAR